MLEGQDSVEATAEATESLSENSEDVKDQTEDSTDSSTVDNEDAKEDKASLLDVVKDAIADKEEAESEESSTSESDEDHEAVDASKEEATEKAETKDEDTDDLEDELSDEDMKSLKPKTRKSIERFRSQIDELRPRAEQFDKINDYMTEAGLQNEEVAGLLEIGSLIKTDPREALPRLEAAVQTIKQQLGEVLPQDLTDQVDAGLVDEDTALELSRSRAEAADLKRRNDELAAEKTTTAKEQDQSVMQEAVNSWVRQTAKSDPDYSMKKSLVEDKFFATVMKDGLPETAEAALKIVQDSYEAINEQLRPMRPQKTATQTTTSTLSTNAKPAPQSLKDAVRQAAGHEI